jgi:hypothetical protein
MMSVINFTLKLTVYAVMAAQQQDIMTESLRLKLITPKEMRNDAKLIIKCIRIHVSNL